jgi:hypothetical protein
VARLARKAYKISMRPWRWISIVPAVAILAIGVGAFANQNQEKVPLYTSEDLDRMFGPAAPRVSDPVDKSHPEDWWWVEQFIDRQYSRIDADREYDQRDRALDIAEARTSPYSHYYGGVAWGLGYPASTWWNSVAGHYNGSYGHNNYYSHPSGHAMGPQGRSGFVPGMGSFRGGSHGSFHGGSSHGGGSHGGHHR